MVYIDNMRADFGRMIMCHMTADTLDELHTMARKLGMKRSWFQNKPGSLPHYDVSLSKRALAIKYGAKEITRKQMVDILIRHRKNPIK